MILHPRHFIRFADGRAGRQIVIAFLPGALGHYLGTLTTDIRLHFDYARKLIVNHQMYYENFAEIQPTIDNGFCFQETDYQLAFLWVKDSIKPEIYYFIVKTDRTKQELWLVTFYRIRKAQYPKKLRPQAILREHVERDFMG